MWPTEFELRKLTHHTDAVWCVAFCPDGKLQATGSRDTTAALVDTETGGVLHKLATLHTGAVKCVAFSPDGKLLATGSLDLTVVLVDTASREVLRKLTHHSQGVSCLSFSPDGKLLATGSSDRTVALVDTASGGVFRSIVRTGPVRCLAFSPDGKLIATGSLDETVALVDTSTGEVLRTLTPHAGIVSCLTLSPDGKTLAAGSWSSTVALIDTASGEVQHRLRRPEAGFISCLAFSPDGKLLATGAGRTASQMHTATGEVQENSTRHNAGIYSIMFSPNGKLLATGSSDRTASLTWIGDPFWTRDMHRYLPRPARELALALMLCAQRIAFAASGLACGGGIRAALVPLPVEIWLLILGFLRGTILMEAATRYDAFRDSWWLPDVGVAAVMPDERENSPRFPVNMRVNPLRVCRRQWLPRCPGAGCFCCRRPKCDYGVRMVHKTRVTARIISARFSTSSEDQIAAAPSI